MEILFLVQHHEMFLVPVQDARKRMLFHQLLYGHLSADRPETDFDGRFIQAQHGHPVVAYGAYPAHGFGRVHFAVMTGYHAEAGGSALHGVRLLDVVETGLEYHQYIIKLFHPYALQFSIIIIELLFLSPLVLHLVRS